MEHHKTAARKSSAYVFRNDIFDFISTRDGLGLSDSIDFPCDRISSEIANGSFGYRYNNVLIPKPNMRVDIKQPRSDSNRN